MSTKGNPNILLVESQGVDPKEEEVNYKNLLSVYIFNRWYIYVLLTTVFVAITYYYVQKSPEIYEITAKLQVKETPNEYTPEDDWLQRNLNVHSTSDNVNNEIEVLTAFSLMHEVVKELDLEINYYNKKGLNHQELYTNSPIYVDTFLLGEIENTEFNLIPIDQNTFAFAQDSIIGRYAYGELFTNSFGTFRIQKKRELPIDSDYSVFVSFSDTKSVAESFLDEFKVEFSDINNKSSVLNLIIFDIVPERGVDLLNTLVKKHNEEKYNKNNEIALKTLEFINERLGEISNELNTVENNLERYKINNDITSETTSDLNLMLEQENQLRQDQRDLKVKISIINTMKENLNNDLTDANELINENLSIINDQILALVQPYNQMVLRRKKLLLTGTSSNPVIQSLNQELESLKSSIIESLMNMKNDLELQLEGIEIQYQNVASRLRSVPRKEKQMGDRSRRQTITQELYVYLLRKKEETSLSLISNFSNSTLVDPPRSSMGPVAPNKKRMYMVGFGGGIFLSFFLIVVLEFFKDNIETEQDIKRILQDGFFIGMINQNKNKERQVVLRQRNASVAESFRALRANLQFHFRNPQKTIMVTSSTSAEGKSFIAANLAMNFALTSKKAIIVDFDLHKPDLEAYLEEKTEEGLSDYFTDTSYLEDIIKPITNFPQLHFISSGPVVAYPSELISEDKVTELFDYLKSNYDIIIIDTPPIGIISDALFLTKHVDISLFVMRAKHTKREMVEKANEMVKKKLLPNPVMVLNGVKDKNNYRYYFKKNAV